MKISIQLLLGLAIIFSACKKKKEELPPPPPSQQDIAVVDQQVEAFLTMYSIPGASIAVSRNGKLVYQKGYGFADSDANEKVNINHRFRLASISKTYTGVAILKLAEAGLLSINDKVFGPGALLGTQYGTQPYSSKLLAVTVKQLLHNTAGGWGAASGGDPIDLNPAMDNETFLSWILDNKPLVNTPGTKYDYSNMGFFILGRIIEKVSGNSYSEYLKQNILHPLNDHVTDTAGAKLSHRKQNEVKYYGQGADAQYVYSIALKRRDADGGLMTSAKGLLQLVTAIDGSATRPDILNASSLAAMTTPSGPAPLSPNYGLGIGVWGNIWYNYGSLPGTRTGFMRSPNGTSVALLLNSRSTNSAFELDMQDLMLAIINDTSIPWESTDQF